VADEHVIPGRGDHRDDIPQAAMRDGAYPPHRVEEFRQAIATVGLRV
jgi:hypothetical protein